MYLKTYQRKPDKGQFIQYDGTVECAEDLSCNLYNIEIVSSKLFFTGDYGLDEIKENDWVRVEQATAKEVIDGDVFYQNYEEVTL
jgi:hypothetical protein